MRRHFIPADQPERHTPSPLCECRPDLHIDAPAELSPEWQWVHKPLPPLPVVVEEPQP